MEDAYEWQKPLEIPRHDEPEAGKKLQTVMEQAVGRLRFPDPLPPGNVRLMETVDHPDTGSSILAFLAQGASRAIYDVPLRVDIFPRDAIRRRKRAYVFHPDGFVIVEAERDGYRMHSDGLDSVEVGRIQGWPEAVRHMFLYIAQVLRDSVRWEIQLAESLEVLAPRGARSIGGDADRFAFARGKLAGEAGLDAAEIGEAYLRGCYVDVLVCSRRGARFMF